MFLQLTSGCLVTDAREELVASGWYISPSRNCLRYAEIELFRKGRKMKLLSEPKICERLRELSDSTPKKIKVMLPACKPTDFYKDDVEVPFVNVGLSKLLHFIADMM